jgi:drug/metabolite transporter (DMT)-like permease
MHTKRLFSKKFFGQSVIFTSMFCFHLESVVVRWATTADVALSSPFLVFARFSLGFLMVALVFILKRKIPRPRQYGTLIGRAITNVFAVFCSYKAVELTTVAEGTILNMTFPVFIGIFSWFLFKEQRDIIALLMTVVAFCGIFFMLTPGELHVEWNSLWGLVSGVIAAVSLILLNIARQHNDTDTVMFVIFGVGTILVYIMFWDHFHIPNQEELFYLVSGAVMAIIGQYLLTLGFRYVTPVEGGIISSIRILIAAILSPYMTSDPPLVLAGWIGALLILGANVYFIARRTG